MAAQIIAVIIFVLMFLLIVTEKIPRHFVTLGCGALMLIVVFGICMKSKSAVMDTLNIKTFADPNFWILRTGEESSSGINWATIIFIFGMMVMVEGMAKAGFFRWLCLGIAKAVKYKVTSIFITFMIMSFILAMFIDSITVILFLAAVTVELAVLLKFSPVPMIIAEIFCANLGGSATMCGDPPNIIIGTSLSYTFGDFVVNTGLIAVISMIFVVLYFYIVFHKHLKSEVASGEKIKYPEPKEAITSKKSFAISCVIFGIAVVLLVTHAMTGLTVAFIGVFICSSFVLLQSHLYCDIFL